MNILMIRTGRVALRRGTVRRRNLIVLRQNSNGTSSSTPTSAKASETIPVPNVISPIPIWQRLGPLSKAFRAYGRAQRTRPYVIQICTSIGIYICGDFSAQKIGGEEYDLWKTVRSMVIGGIFSIPSYRWFLYLGESFNFSSKILSLTTKVVVNQIVFTPIFNTYFFGTQSLLSGNSPAEAWDRIQRTVPTSFINSCKLWPAVTAFSFTFVQPQYRNLFAGIIAIGWQTYLSYLNNRAVMEREVERVGLINSVAETASNKQEQPGLARANA